MPTFMIMSEPHSVQLSAEGRTSLVNCNDGRVVERPLLFVSITSVCLHPEVEGQAGRCQDEHSPGQEWGRTHSACLWQYQRSWSGPCWQHWVLCIEVLVLGH